jgi:hypothetical protein
MKLTADETALLVALLREHKDWNEKTAVYVLGHDRRYPHSTWEGGKSARDKADGHCTKADECDKLIAKLERGD